MTEAEREWAAVDYGDLSDLPPEVLKELSFNRRDEVGDTIKSLIIGMGGEASIDQVLIGLWRQFGKKRKRCSVRLKLSQMVKAGTLISVAGHKGVYAIESGEHLKEGR